MRLRILSVIGLALLLLCATCPVRGATPDWTAVHGLSAGARVHVSLTSGKSLHGTIDHVSAAALYLQNRTETAEVRRDDISRLYLEEERPWRGCGDAGGGACRACRLRRRGGGG